MHSKRTRTADNHGEQSYQNILYRWRNCELIEQFEASNDHSNNGWYQCNTSPPVVSKEIDGAMDEAMFIESVSSNHRVRRFLLRR